MPKKIKIQQVIKFAHRGNRIPVAIDLLTLTKNNHMQHVDISRASESEEKGKNELKRGNALGA